MMFGDRMALLDGGLIGIRWYISRCYADCGLIGTKKCDGDRVGALRRGVPPYGSFAWKKECPSGVCSQKDGCHLVVKECIACPCKGLRDEEHVLRLLKAEDVNILAHGPV
jgi:hypothetical protein